MRARIFMAALGAALLVGTAAGAAPDEQKGEAAEKKAAAPAKEKPAGTQARAASAGSKPAALPRVFTNEDLEKYGPPGRRRSVRPPSPAPPLAPGSPPPAPPELPPEERLDAGVTPAVLWARERELAALLEFLEAKERGLRNPFGRPPSPAPGESLVDPERTGAEELTRTRRRIDDTSNRLDTIRALRSATAPPR